MDKLPSFYLVSVALLGLTSGAGVLPDGPVYKAVGEAVKFNTTLTSEGKPFGNIIWRFKETPIIISNVVNNTQPGYEDRITLFSSTGSLELRNLALNDSGEYSVTISQGVTEHGGSTTLNVLERISGASLKPSTNQAIEGNSVNLTCDAAGSMLTRKWMINGSDLTLADHMKFDEEKKVLSFQPLKKTDRGEYLCEISNPIGSMEAKHSLVVNYGPEKVQIKGQNKVQIGHTITLTCSAESEPSASFIWSVKGTEIHNAAVYIKEDAEVQDSGNYTCQAKNAVTGRSQSAVHELTVTDIPTPSPSSPCPPGCVAGIVIACLVVIGAAAGVGYYFYRKKKSKGNSSIPREGGGGQNNSTFTENKDSNYADLAAFHRKDGGVVQLRPQNETSEYAQVAGNNNAPTASSLPTYEAHVQRTKRQAPQPAANEAQPYARAHKN